MEISIFLAKVIGLVSLISAGAVLVRYRKNLSIEKEAVSNPALAALAGYAILILGTLLVVSHSVWTLDWRIVITILGWLVFLKGIGRIFFPEAVIRMIERKQKNYWFILGEIVMLLVSIYLLYYGFIIY
ncbi:MAG TPA: hypothetical protein VJH63_01485 [Candidatus Paceibacterota bacterium]